MIDLTDLEIRLILRWADAAWNRADQERMRSMPGSAAESVWLADQEEIEEIRRKLRNR